MARACLLVCVALEQGGQQQQPGGKLGEGEAAHDSSPTADFSKREVRRHLV